MKQSSNDAIVDNQTRYFIERLSCMEDSVLMLYYAALTFTPKAPHVVQTLPADIAEFPLDVYEIGPTMRYGIL